MIEDDEDSENDWLGSSSQKPIRVDVDSSSGADFTLSEIKDLYPELTDSMQIAAERCQCGCKSSIERLDMDGCLQALAVTQLLLLVAHGLVDSAGVRDISNFYGENSAHSLIDATIVILVGIATRGEID